MACTCTRAIADQLAFYGAYHNNRWNKLIHFIFVPAIIWSLLVWLAYSGNLMPSVDTSDVQAKLPFPMPIVLNAAAAVVAMYSLFYLTLEPVAGLTWALLTGVPLWLSATWFRQEVDNAWMWAIPVHLLGWFMQIVPGHAYFEKRKPALLDSLIQAFALAPLFVWFELLFAVGYRPGLHSQLQARVDKELAANKLQHLRRRKQH